MLTFFNKNFNKIARPIVMIIILMMATPVYSQTIEEIKRSKKYLWGEGTGTHPKKADQDALAHLISQISVTVKSKFTNVVEEYGGDVEDYTEHVVETYSNVMLNEAKMIEKNKGNIFHVIRYIEKDNVSAIFEDRKVMIMDFINSGYDAKKEYRIGDALKYYYWSLCLLKSHPDMQKIRGEEVGIKGPLFIALPDIIETILDSVKITKESERYFPEEERKRILLNLKYGKQAISNLDYIYFTGDNWRTRLTTGSDGLGVIDLWGPAAKDMNEIRLRIEYVYEHKCKHIGPLAKVIENTYIPYFAKAEKRVTSFFNKKIPKKDKIKTTVIGSSVPENNSLSNEDYIETVLKFKDACNKKSFSSLEGLLTENGKNYVNKLFKYGEAKIIKTGAINLQMIKLSNQYIIRSIPFKFSFPHSNREFIEDVVFILDEEAKIDGINFALNDRSINDIMKMSERFGSLERKQQLIHFMESYKTAYCLEDLDYIDKIFSDNALIIIGQKLDSLENIDNMYSSKLSENEVFYIRLDKKQYIERLRRIFNGNESINIHFEEATVRKVSQDNDYIYGIQIAQDYYSTNYSDFGYLFLMFDLNKPEEPKIYVRSWQPEKNKDGRIIGLEDFIIN